MRSHCIAKHSRASSRRPLHRHSKAWQEGEGEVMKEGRREDNGLVGTLLPCRWCHRRLYHKGRAWHRRNNYPLSIKYVSVMGVRNKNTYKASMPAFLFRPELPSTHNLQGLRYAVAPPGKLLHRPVQSKGKELYGIPI